MLTGELFTKTGLSKDTVRFYETAELVSLSRRQGRPTIKGYPGKVLKKLTVIQELKGFGFILNEVQEMIPLYEDDLLTTSDDIPKKDKISAIDSDIEKSKK